MSNQTKLRAFYSCKKNTDEFIMESENKNEVNIKWKVKM